MSIHDDDHSSTTPPLVDFAFLFTPPSLAAMSGRSKKLVPFAASRVEKLVPMSVRKRVGDEYIDVDKMAPECEAVAHLAFLSAPTLQTLVKHMERQLKVSFNLNCFGHS